MAYFTQEQKKQMTPKIKAVLSLYGLKGSLSVNRHSTVVLTIQQGPIDFIGNTLRVAENTLAHQPGNEMLKRSVEQDRETPPTYLKLNEYHYQSHHTGDALRCLKDLFAILFEGNHDRSDIMTDYFDVGWYVNLHIGRWDRPYQYQPDQYFSKRDSQRVKQSDQKAVA